MKARTSFLMIFLILLVVGCQEPGEISAPAENVGLTTTATNIDERFDKDSPIALEGTLGVAYNVGSKWTHKIKYKFKLSPDEDPYWGIATQEEVIEAVNAAADKWNEYLHDNNKFQEVSTGANITIDLSSTGAPTVSPSPGGNLTKTVLLPPNSMGYAVGVFETALHELCHVLGLLHFGEGQKSGHAYYPSNAKVKYPNSITEIGPDKPSTGDLNALYYGLGYPQPSGGTNPDPPSAPYIYTSISNCHPKLYWNAVSGADAYKVYRRMNTSSGTYYYTGQTTSLNYVDYELTLYTCNAPGNKVYYYYKVKAFNAGGESNFSNWRKFTIDDDELF